MFGSIGQNLKVIILIDDSRRSLLFNQKSCLLNFTLIKGNKTRNKGKVFIYIIIIVKKGKINGKKGKLKEVFIRCVPLSSHTQMPNFSYNIIICMFTLGPSCHTCQIVIGLGEKIVSPIFLGCQFLACQFLPTNPTMRQKSRTEA